MIIFRQLMDATMLIRCYLRVALDYATGYADDAATPLIHAADKALLPLLIRC